MALRVQHEETEVADPLIGALNNSAAHLGMCFGVVLLGNGSKPVRCGSAAPRRSAGPRRGSG